MSANSEPIKKQFTQKVSTSNEVQVFHFETESALVLITGSQTGQTLDLRRDNDLGGLAFRRLGKGFQ